MTNDQRNPKRQGASILAEAVVLWTGWDRFSWPHRDDSAVVDRYGPEVAANLLSLIRSLYDDFYTSDAFQVATSLQEMGKMASEQFKTRHPEIPGEVVRAFAWCYTFDYK